MDTRTVDTILESLKKKVENKEIVHPSWWIEAAEFMNILLGEEQDALFLKQQEIAKHKKQILLGQAKRNVSEVNLMIEATDEYREMRQLEAKIKRVQEQIKIAKVHARMAQDELNWFPRCPDSSVLWLSKN